MLTKEIEILLAVKAEYLKTLTATQRSSTFWHKISFIFSIANSFFSEWKGLFLFPVCPKWITVTKQNFKTSCSPHTSIKERSECQLIPCHIRRKTTTDVLWTLDTVRNMPDYLSSIKYIWKYSQTKVNTVLNSRGFTKQAELIHSNLGYVLLNNPSAPMGYLSRWSTFPRLS